jgi:DNA-directed RNA polymerase subunit RPC12/RpoP
MMRPESDLRVEVVDDEIIVILPGSHYSATYYKPFCHILQAGKISPALEERLAERKAARELARTAAMRGDQFAPELDGNYQCPICWVSNGIHADLTPIQSDTTDDLFRCENCNRKIEIGHPH